MDFIKKYIVNTWYGRPVFDCSTQVWSPIHKGNIDRIESVCTKVLCKACYWSRKFIIIGSGKLRIPQITGAVCNGYVDMDISDFCRF